MNIKRKTFVNIKRFFFSALLLAIVMGWWYFYSKTEAFTITKYTFTGINDDSLRLELENKLKSVAKTTSYKLLPPTKLLTFQKSSIINTVQGVLPETRTLRVVPHGLHTIHIMVTTHTPLFRVDKGEALSTEGVFFTTKKDISDLSVLSIASSTRISHKNGGISSQKLQNIDSATLRNLDDFEKKVSSVIFPVTSIVIDNIGDVHLSSATSRSKVIITKDADMKKLWLTLLSAIDTDPLKTKLLKNLDSLMYLDVRFGNKVFYSFATSTVE